MVKLKKINTRIRNKIVLKTLQKFKYKKLKTWLNFDEGRLFHFSTVIFPHSPTHIIKREKRGKITALGARVIRKVKHHL